LGLPRGLPFGFLLSRICSFSSGVLFLEPIGLPGPCLGIFGGKTKSAGFRIHGIVAVLVDCSDLGSYLGDIGDVVFCF